MLDLCLLPLKLGSLHPSFLLMGTSPGPAPPLSHPQHPAGTLATRWGLLVAWGPPCSAPRGRAVQGGEFLAGLLPLGLLSLFLGEWNGRNSSLIPWCQLSWLQPQGLWESSLGACPWGMLHPEGWERSRGAGREGAAPTWGAPVAIKLKSEQFGWSQPDFSRGVKLVARSLRHLQV